MVKTASVRLLLSRVSVQASVVGSRGFKGTAKAETRAPAMDMTMVKYNLRKLSGRGEGKEMCCKWIVLQVCVQW